MGHSKYIPIQYSNHLGHLATEPCTNIFNTASAVQMLLNNTDYQNQSHPNHQYINPTPIDEQYIY